MVSVRKPWIDQGRIKMTLPSDDLADIGWTEGQQLVVRNEGDHLTLEPIGEDVDLSDLETKP